jgi:hypothetical protein
MITCTRSGRVSWDYLLVTGAQPLTLEIAPGDGKQDQLSNGGECYGYESQGKSGSRYRTAANMVLGSQLTISGNK